jgi:glycine cleavage system H protein
MVPDDLRYTSDHEWVRLDGDVARIGITDFAQDALGDIVYVNVPDVGAPVTAGAAFGEVESTKSVSDVYAPVGGTVEARNEQLGATPELVNSDPYGEGWILEIRGVSAADVAGLLDAAAYRALIEEA